MKSTVAAATALALAIAATTASAGVVITEKASTKSQAGERKTERTVMVQGLKKKIIKGDQELIIDLEAGKMSVLRRTTKSYAEGPFPPLGIFRVLTAREGMAVGVKKDANTHKLNGYACQDYSGSMQASHTNVSVIECVASGAPGAKEYVEFQRAMVQKLADSPLKVTGEIPDGIPVSSITTVTPLAFAATGGVSPELLAKLQADMNKQPTITRIGVSKIEVKDIPAAEFTVPADFKKQEMPRLTIKPKPGAAAAPKPAPH